MAPRARVPTLVRRTLLVLALGAGVVVLAGTPPATNAWLSVTEPAYVIPAESSLWRFTPTEMNDGSGGWWIYGEDDRNHYYFTGVGEPPYITLSKSDAATCAGFDSADVSTWCR
ncbi:hypothetical protein JRC04_19205 [Mycolicibacterium sp. S2-37]|uniref:hypothetical protein n=1 Tax=Mycolicibacterium sp. S2-37 TaxID=2810297 RepID=UPI001A94481F|nr:hypothetical protein [Mycolicibacterium sp. S2-37]MBO0679597.1 hypothetical protein [Mycolicibacterium sp. S2-37]